MLERNYFNSEKAFNISGILVIVLVGSLVLYSEKETWLLPYLAILIVSIFSGFITFLMSTERTQKIRIFWVQSILIALLFISVAENSIAILTIPWVVQAAELYGSRRASLLAFLSISAFVLSQIYHNGLENLLQALISGVLYGLFLVFALSVVQRGIRERMHRENTELLNRELLATRELLSQSTAQAERVRIARNLHDILGHHMTALILNLEVANHSVRQSLGSEDEKLNPERESQEFKLQIERTSKAQDKVEQALALAKLLLGDIRTAVSELREDDKIELQHSIERLTEDIPNIIFDIDCRSAPPIRSVQLAEVFLRCAQESITNVIRHSNASKCQISLTESEDRCVLTVSDNGRFESEILPGNGIKGMQERVSAIGGAIRWAQSSEGCSVHIEIPLGANNED